MLITGIFSLSVNVLIMPLLQELCNSLENSWKRRKCWFPAFSPFPTMFSTGIFIKWCLILINFVFDRFEHIIRKGENAGFQHFLLFLQCFQQVSSLKLGDIR